MTSHHQMTTKVDRTVELTESEVEGLKEGEPLSKEGVLLCPEGHPEARHVSTDDISRNDKYSYSAIYEVDTVSLHQLSEGKTLLFSPDYESPVMAAVMDSVLLSQK